MRGHGIKISLLENLTGIERGINWDSKVLNWGLLSLTVIVNRILFLDN